MFGCGLGKARPAKSKMDVPRWALYPRSLPADVPTIADPNPSCSALSTLGQWGASFSGSSYPLPIGMLSTEAFRRAFLQKYYMCISFLFNFFFVLSLFPSKVRMTLRHSPRLHSTLPTDLRAPCRLERTTLSQCLQS